MAVIEKVKAKRIVGDLGSTNIEMLVSANREKITFSNDYYGIIEIRFVDLPPKLRTQIAQSIGVDLT